MKKRIKQLAYSFGVFLIFLSCIKDVPPSLNAVSNISDYRFVLMGQCTYLTTSDSVEFDFEIYEFGKNIKQSNQWTNRWYDNVAPSSEFESRVLTSSGIEVNINKVVGKDGAFYYGGTSLRSDTFWLFLESEFKKYDSIAIVPFKGVDSLTYDYNYLDGELQNVEFSFHVLQDSTTVFFDHNLGNHAGSISSELYSGLWHSNENFSYLYYRKKGYQKELLSTAADYYSASDREPVAGIDTLNYEDEVRLGIDAGFLKPEASSMKTIQRNLQLGDYSKNALNPYVIPESFPVERSNKDLVIEFYSYQTFKK